MRAKSTLKYIISLLLLLSQVCAYAQDGDSDTTKRKIETKGLHQLCIGIDIAQPITSALAKNRNGYEMTIDYFCGKETYAVLEGGFGNAKVDYADLKYSSTNTFFRIGINKSILTRLTSNDWDMGFIGVRYGIAAINRSAGTYTVIDAFYGNTTGTIAAKSFLGHWAEIVGGMRVAIIKDLSAGWTIRGKFLLNAGAFKELSPSYVAGYGKGDKTSAFDYNFYINYAIHWSKKKPAVPAPAAK
jgi:hypothetical protein